MATAARPGRLRRALRWVRRLVIGVVGLALLAVGAVVVLLDTDWGRDLVRGKIEAALRAQFPGGAKIGRLEGSAFGTLTAFDVELDGRDGRPMVTIRALTIDAALRPLASHRVHVNSLVVDGLVVDLHPQPPAPPEPPAPPSASAPSGPLPWSIELPRVELHDARVTYTPATGAPIHVERVELAAAVSAPAPADGARFAPPVAASLWVSGEWRERGAFSLGTSATYDVALQQLVVPLLAAHLADASVSAAGLRAELGAVPAVQGVLSAHAPRAALVALGVPVDAAVPPGADVDAVIDVAPLSKEAQLGARLAGADLVQVAVWAAAGPARVHGFLALDVVRRLARGLVNVDDADLAASTHGQARGHAHIVAAIEASLAGVRGLLSVNGDVDGVPPSRLIVAIDAAPAKLIVTAAAAGAAASHIGVLAEIQRAGDGYALTRGRLSVRAADPARASAGRLPVRGAVWLDARARGPLWPEPALVVEADAGATDLLVGTAGARAARAHLSADHVPASSDAYVHLDLTAPRAGTAALADASLDVHAVAPAGEPVRVDLTRHRVRTLADAVFSGAGGRVVIAPDKIEVRDLRTGVAGSAIAVSGSFAPATADLSAKVTVTNLALGAVAPALAGTAGGTLAVARRGGRWSGGGDLSTRGLVAQAGRPPIDADLHLTVAGSRVTAHATAANADIFAIALDVDLDGPRDLTSPAGWRAVPRSAIHRVALAVDRLDLDAALAAAGLAPAELPVHGGGVSGAIALSPEGATGELVARDLRGPAGDVTATLGFTHAAPRELAAAVHVVGEHVGEASATARAALPAHLLAPAEWAALDLDALHGAQVTLAEQPFDPELFARFGLAVPYTGRAALTLTTTAGGATTTLAADVSQVTGGVIAQPVTTHADATLDADGFTAALAVTTPKTPLATARAHAPLTLARLIAVGRAALEHAPLTGDLEVPKMQLPAALAVVDRNDITAGVLAGALTFGGTLGTPTATGTLAATAVTVAPGISAKPLPRLDDLTLDIRWGGVAGTLDAVAHESNGGVLTLHGSGGPTNLAAGRLDLTAQRLDLAPLAAFGPASLGGAGGTLDADLHIQGFDPGAASLTGELTLSRGRFPLSPKVGTLRDLGATVRVDGPTLHVTADGKLGAGGVKVTGDVDLAGGGLRSTDLTIALRQFSPIGAVQPVIDADVTAKLAHAAGKWTGKVSVTHAAVAVSVTGGGRKLLPTGEPSDMEFVDAPPPPPKSIHLDAPADPWLVVTVDVAPTEVVIDDSRIVVKASDLELSYGDELGLDGYVDTDRGDADVFGRRYQVELGLLTFDGGTDPELNISISHAFADVTTYADISGRLSEPVLSLHADPALYTQGQLLGFLLGGDPTGDPSSQASDEAAVVGASVASAYLSQKLNKHLPVKVALRCNPPTSNASAQCTAGKWLSSKLYVGYLQRLAPLPDENISELGVQYYLLSHLLLDLTGGDRNDSADLLWRKRW